VAGHRSPREHDAFRAVVGDVLDGGQPPGREPVQVAPLHHGPDPFVRRDQLGGLDPLVCGPRPDITGQPEDTGHGGVKSEAQRCRPAGDRIRAVGHPCAHHHGRIDLPESILDGQPVDGIGVVRRPYLIGPGHDPEVGPPATTGAALDAQTRMRRAEAIDHLVHAGRVVEP
jgi:hypothetical protein